MSQNMRNGAPIRRRNSCRRDQQTRRPAPLAVQVQRIERKQLSREAFGAAEAERVFRELPTSVQRWVIVRPS